MKLLLTITFLFLFALPGISQIDFFEGFKNSSTTNSWNIGGTAYLTSNNGDPDGDGWLRLTAGYSQLGYASTSSPIDFSSGATLSFDFAIWGGSGADGMAIAFFDGNETYSPGSAGGGVGYELSSTNLYAGVGISSYPTSFSNGNQNSVSIRGSKANGLPFRTAQVPGQALHFSNSSPRPVQEGTNFRKLILTLTPDRKLSVSVQFGAGNEGTLLIDSYDMSSDFPLDLSNIKIVLTGATGGAWNYFELRNFSISSPAKVITLPAAPRNITSATLNGSILPVDTSVVRFVYGISSGIYTDSLYADQNELNMDTVYHAVSANLSGLSAETQYFFKVTSLSDSGYFAGNELSFRTLAIEPELASSDLMIDSVNTNFVYLDWSNSDPGAHHLVVISPDFPTEWTPEDGVTYGSWSDSYGSSASLSGGGYLVYNGDADSVVVNNLQPTSTYYVTIFDYYGSNSSQNYNTTSVLSGSFETLQTPFNDVTPEGTNGISWGDAAWGDFNADGRMDFAEAGYNFLYVFYNNGEGFSKMVLREDNYASNPKIAWGDYDKDGFLDLAFAGDGVLTIYKAVQGEGWDFAVNMSLDLNLQSMEISWIDYDLDGDLDLFVTGEAGGSGPRKLTKTIPVPTKALFYRNDGSGYFTEIKSNLPLLSDPSVNFADVNGDGNPDLFLTGSSTDWYNGRFSGLFYGNGTSEFTMAELELPQTYRGEAAIGDFNSDGFPDFIYTGATGDGGRETGYFQGDGEGGFVRVPTELTPLARASVSAGDYDNDGDLDLVFTGRPGSSEGLTYLAINDGEGNFSEVDAGLPQLHSSTVAWGDLNGDGNLDLLLGGEDYYNESNEFYVLLSNSSSLNNAPGEPISAFSSSVDKNSVLLQWGIGADTETPGFGLTYNFRVGTTPGGSEIVRPAVGEQLQQEAVAAKAQANAPSSFFSLLPAAGNAGQNQFTKLNRLAPGTYYWSVQTVDHSSNVSGFSTEQSFEITEPLPPLGPSGLSFYTEADTLILTWNSLDVPGLLNYKVYQSDGLDTLLLGTTEMTEYRVTEGVVRGKFYTFFVSGVVEGPLEGEWSSVIGGLTNFDVQSFPLNSGYRNGLVVGDFDNDGKPDLINSYSYSVSFLKNMGVAGPEDEMYQAGDIKLNEPYSLFETPGYNSFIKAADYNNDGRLDLAVASQNRISIYRNDGTETEMGVPAFTEVFYVDQQPYNNALLWADLDHDGDLDLISSRNDTGYVMVFVNQFNDQSEMPFETKAIFPNGTTEGYLDAADVDHDGDLDILISGFADTDSDWDTKTVSLFLNNGPSGEWIETEQSFPGSFKGSTRFGDFNNDGYADFIAIGSVGGGGREVHLYQNNHEGGFTEVTTDFTGFAASTATWGDLNGDGNPDLVLTGISGSADNGDERSTQIWFNNGEGGFILLPESFEGMIFGSVELADMDLDGDLDVVTLGNRLYSGGEGGLARSYSMGDPLQILVNETGSGFNLPLAPETASVSSLGPDYAVLSWASGSDLNTPAAALTYNIRVFSQLNEKEMVSFMADAETGVRLLAATGNTGSARTFKLKNLPEGDYSWWIQTINHELNASGWHQGPDFTINSTVPVELASFSAAQKADQVILTWATKTETNNHGFEIEKKSNGKSTESSWTSVGFVAGAGTTTEEKTYHFSTAAGKEKVLFRLKQIDADGKVAYSDVLAFEPGAPTVFAMEQNYPNPFNPVTSIPISLPKAGLVSMKVFDILGREVATLLNEKREAGYYTVQFDGAKLSSGVYFVRLESQGKTALKKLTLLK